MSVIIRPTVNGAFSPLAHTLISSIKPICS